MKKLLTLLAIAAIPVFIINTGCKKQQAFKNEDGKVSEDNRNVQSQADEAFSDANKALSSNATIAGRAYKIEGASAALLIINGANVDTSQKAQGILTITYDGVTVINNRKRSGTIKLTLQDFPSKKWKDAGAVLQVDYIAYKVVRASDGKGIQFDGTHLLTNVSGGNWVTLLFLTNHPNLVHKVTGTDLNVTFDDGKIAKWNINRQYTYSYGNNVFTCTGEGLGSQNGINNLENWGTTRDGDAFTSQVVESVVWNTTCGAHAPITGKLNIIVAAKEFELTSVIGVDNNGNPVTPAANACPYGLKVSWKWKTKTGSKIYPYQ